MKCSYRSIDLPFRYPFTISKGTKTSQPALVVELEHRGIKGYGEAPAITYYQVTVDQMISDLEARKTMVEKFAFTSPERYWHYLHHVFPRNPFLVCALDIAAWDLFGKMQRQPVRNLVDLNRVEEPVTDYTIGIDSAEKMLAKMAEKPWPVYKIKVGTPDDVERVALLRRHTDVPFRVDANAGWTLAEALDKIPRLAALGVEFIEQPLAKDDFEGMRRLFRESPLPLMADESCVAEEDVERCAGAFHGINIKLTKCSGLTPAIRMIRKARELNLSVMVGCMNESSIGAAAIGQLLPFIDYADMDGPLLLAEDIAEGLTFDYGKVQTSGGPGLGITVNANLFT